MKKFIFPGFLLIIILSVVFIWLGGNSSVEYELVDLEPTVLYGYDYRGRPTQPELEKLFFKVRDASTFMPGEYLTIISYGVESTVDTLHQFIGTQHEVLNNTDSAVQKVVDGGRFVRVALNMHSLVRPSPGNVRDGAVEFASSEGLEISEWNLEVFTADDVLTVYFPVLE